MKEMPEQTTYSPYTIVDQLVDLITKHPHTIELLAQYPHKIEAEVRAVLKTRERCASCGE